VKIISVPSRVPNPMSNVALASNLNAVDKRINYFQQISEPIRHSILELLSKDKELSVTDIINKLKKPQTLISYHLRCLKELGLLNIKKDEEDGRKTLYSLHAPKEVQAMFSFADNYITKHNNCGNNPCNIE
jgi:DNA-binding transcriptional ArsR family regulator